MIRSSSTNKQTATPRWPLSLELVILSLVAIISSASCGLIGNSKSAPQVDEFYMGMRPGTGHFANHPIFGQLFNEYFTSVTQPLDASLANLDLNSWRYFRPTGEMCVSFLQKFKEARGYSLTKPLDLVPLDACLGWLFDTSSEKQDDYQRFNSKTLNQVKALEKDRKLREIFDSTALSDQNTNPSRVDVPDILKSQIQQYISELLAVFKDNPRNGCHGFWLKAYNDFIEDVYLGDCENDLDCVYFGTPGLDEDPYVKLVVESTKENTLKCYKQLQVQMLSLMQTAFKDESISIRLKATTSKVAQQMQKMKWSKELLRILQLVGGDPKKPISIATVVENLYRIKREDDEAIDNFMTSIANYAIQNVDLKDSANDPEGRARFGMAMTKLCRPYIDETEFLSATGGSSLVDEAYNTQKPFDFFQLIYSLIRVTNHEDMYGVTKTGFEQELLKKGWDTLYLATFACQIISTTWGELSYDTNQPAYEVTLKKGASVLIEDWPIDVIHEHYENEKDEEKVEIEAPSVSASPSSASSTSSSSDSGSKKSEGSMFGFKKFGFGFKSSDSKTDKPESTTTPSPPLPVKEEEEPVEEEPEVSAEVPKSPPRRRKAPHHSLKPPKFLTKQSEVEQTTTTTTPAPLGPPKMSLESINLFANLHGRYPDLPDNIRDYYPSIPEDYRTRSVPKTAVANFMSKYNTVKPKPKRASALSF